MRGRTSICSVVIWFSRCGIPLARFVVVFAGLVCLSEFLMSLFPCFALVVFNPFLCLLLVGLYQDEVGFLHEFRHYPVLLALAIWIVLLWSRRDRRKQIEEAADRR